MRFTLSFLAFAAVAAAQPTLPNAVPMPGPEIQYLDSQGKPLAGGKLCTYEAGTSTPLATYTDSTAGTPNTNPVVLDVFGRASVWIGPLSYKFVLRTGGTAYPASDACTTGAVQWTQDNVSASSGGGGGGGMTWPSSAGVANYIGGSSWGTSYSVGTDPNDLVQLNGSGQLPAVSAALLTNWPTFNQSTTGNAATATALAAIPTQCLSGTAPTGILANGDATGCQLLSGGGASFNVPIVAPAIRASALAIGDNCTVGTPCTIVQGSVNSKYTAGGATYTASSGSGTVWVGQNNSAALVVYSNGVTGACVGCTAYSATAVPNSNFTLDSTCVYAASVWSCSPANPGPTQAPYLTSTGGTLTITSSSGGQIINLETGPGSGNTSIVMVPPIPTIVSSYPTGTTFNKGAYTLVQEQYLYATWDSGGFGVFDISNKSSAPVLIGYLNCPTSASAGCNGISLYGAEGIAAVGHYVFVAHEQASSSGGYGGMVVIDVAKHAHPANLTEVSLDYPTNLSLSGDVLYVTGTNNDAGKAQFTAIGVSDPPNPKILGIITDSRMYLAAYAVIQWPIAYVTCRLNYSHTDGALVTVDVTDPSKMTILGSYSASVNSDTGMVYPTGVAVRAPYAFVAGTDNSTLEVLKISDPASITLVTSYQDAVDYPGISNVHLADNYLYATSYGSCGPGGHSHLAVVNVSNPTSIPAPISLASPALAAPSGTYNACFDHLDIDGRFGYMIDNNGFGVPNSGTIFVADLGGITTQALNAGRVQSDDIDVNHVLRVGGDIFVAGAVKSGEPTGIPFINVLTFGADNSGIADSSDSLQGALDSAGVHGGTVFIPEGTYRTSYNILIPENVTLLGSGPGSILEPLNSSGVGCVLWANSAVSHDVSGDLSEIRISNFKINGNRFNGGSPSPSGADICVSYYTNTHTTSHIAVDHMELTGAASQGVAIADKSKDVTVDDCYIHDNGGVTASTDSGTGVFVGGSSSAVFPSGVHIRRDWIEHNHNTVTSAGPSGCIFYAGFMADIEDNDCKDNYNVTGGQISVGEGQTVNNRIWLADSTALSQVTGGIEEAGTNFVIANNYVKNSTEVGIVVEVATTTPGGTGTVSGNTTVGNPVGIMVGTSAGVVSHVNVTGNNDSDTSPIEVDNAATSVVLSGNDHSFAMLYSNLPTCSASTAGITQEIRDSSTIVWGATIAGGGGNKVSAHCNGTNWTVAGI